MKVRLYSALAAAVLGGGFSPAAAFAREAAAAAPVEAPTSPAKSTEKEAEEDERKTGGDYVRFVQDDKAAKLEVAVRSFVNKAGRAVDLVGVVHIADAPYYHELNTVLAGYDKVLFELVGDPDVLTGKAPPEEKSTEEPDFQFRVLRTLYDFMGKYLKLSFQLSEVDYKHARFIHADMNAEEFSRQQKERGESLATIMLRSMEMQMKGQFSSESARMEDLNLAKLIYILTSKNGAAEFKIMLARMLALSESLTGRMESETPSVILSDRNEVVIKKLGETLTETAGGKIAVFYGAAHMPGIAKTMMEELGFEASGEKWLTAWNMPVIPPPAAAAPDKAPAPAPAPADAK